jgi:hypothetical protein
LEKLLAQALVIFLEELPPRLDCVLAQQEQFSGSTRHPPQALLAK